MGSVSAFDYGSLKESLKDFKGEVLLPNDGAKYEKSIERWGEQCIKRAVSIMYSYSRQASVSELGHGLCHEQTCTEPYEHPFANVSD